MQNLPSYLLDSSKSAHSCPINDDLIDFAEGIYREEYPEKHRAIEEHLSSCKACLEDLQVIKQVLQEAA